MGCHVGALAAPTASAGNDVPRMRVDACATDDAEQADSDECDEVAMKASSTYGALRAACASPIGDWLGVWELIDGFLREIGRAERIFHLADPSAVEWGMGILLCAHSRSRPDRAISAPLTRSSLLKRQTREQKP